MECVLTQTLNIQQHNNSALCYVISWTFNVLSCGVPSSVWSIFINVKSHTLYSEHQQKTLRPASHIFSIVFMFTALYFPREPSISFSSSPANTLTLPQFQHNKQLLPLNQSSAKRKLPRTYSYYKSIPITNVSYFQDVLSYFEYPMLITYKIRSRWQKPGGHQISW